MESEIERFQDVFDSVVMLTWSDWHKEMRSNRYNYAVRFAQLRPVLFVQADLSEESYRFEKTEVPGIEILHLWSGPGPSQTRLLKRALDDQGIRAPLLWVYGARYHDFLRYYPAPLKIYHATEDYFGKDHPQSVYVSDLVVTLKSIDLLIAVSEGVRANFQASSGYNGKSIVVTNGCDWSFWSELVRPAFESRNGSNGTNGSYPGPVPATSIPATSGRSTDRSKTGRNGTGVALYQGGIHNKLDYDLLTKTVDLLPEWQFWFCGEVQEPSASWDALRSRPNVKYHGKLAVEEVRKLTARTDVGLIPFVAEDWITRGSFPLKAFEYVASGLPVVSIPIDALMPYEQVFRFAESSEEFARQMRTIAPSRHERPVLKTRLETSKAHDYDAHFQTIISEINQIELPTAERKAKLEVLVLYDDNSTHVGTIREHLDSFSEFSRHDIWYAVATRTASLTVDLDRFDAVLIHYSVRLSLDWFLAPDFARALNAYRGFKVLFIQDEYENTETARRWIEELKLDFVFTCVPEESRELVYPSHRFQGVRFEQNLTGYVPASLQGRTGYLPLEEREVLIGYRGRPLAYWYGNLGQEKLRIGIDMRRICEERGLNVDIEWEEDKRIYGDDWYRWLGSCRATLGTESGANIFDWNGYLKADIEAALATRPGLTYEEAFEKYLEPHEGRVRMNQISPKIFEAVALRTALILFRGEYSGVVKPDVHYIPLEKDYSNVDEVLEKLTDDESIRSMTDRAYRDVIESGEWGYPRFVERVDEVLESHVRPRSRGRPIRVFLGNQSDFSRKVCSGIEAERFFLGHLVTNRILAVEDLRLPVDVSRQVTSVLARDETTSVPIVSTQAVAADPVLNLKLAAVERLGHRPLTLGFLKVCYRTVRGTYRVVRGAKQRVSRVFRRG